MTRLYKATELAELLNVDIKTIYRARDRGEIDFIRVGRAVRYLMPEKGQNNESKSGNDVVHPRMGDDGQ